VPQPLLSGVDDGPFAEAAGLTLHVHEVLQEASQRFSPPLLDGEQVSGSDRVVVVSLEVLQHGLPELFP
jgi:hypothetical protein